MEALSYLWVLSCVYSFAGDKPSGLIEDFLTGFISDMDKSEVYGRPVGVTVLSDGSMLLADDVSDVVWKVAAVK